LAAGLLVLAVAAIVLRPDPAPEEPAVTDGNVDEAAATPESATSIDPNDLGVSAPDRTSPGDLLARARTRALGWNKEATLVSITAAPVGDGTVDLRSGGRITYEFGTPTGEGFGPGTKVGAARFFVEVGSSGTDVREGAGEPARATTEPTCPLDEAVAKARASGLPKDVPLTASYGMSERHDKAVWTIEVSDTRDRARTLDAFNCAILVR
jgi:hypothetical protein